MVLQRPQCTTLFDNSNWEIEKNVDNGDAFGTFWPIESFRLPPSYELVIAKVDSYGFDKSSSKLIHSYFSNGKQRAKINDRYN